MNAVALGAWLVETRDRYADLGRLRHPADSDRISARRFRINGVAWCALFTGFVEAGCAAMLDLSNVPVQRGVFIVIAAVATFNAVEARVNRSQMRREAERHTEGA